ncbi:hypothetical protein DPEC_G00115860 [Dallia pectoralis]|uniref:Uncharacterized protein n=1 Tax=Dallia pectoralis TaxID=75939 RepID=A0ACC2GUG1_DALPE|nr:hypothetical protein DPEC_G00115860 [Dallia pectoralis]
MCWLVWGGVLAHAYIPRILLQCDTPLLYIVLDPTRDQISNPPGVRATYTELVQSRLTRVKEIRGLYSVQSSRQLKHH